MKMVSRLLFFCVCIIAFASSCQKELTLNDSLPVTKATAMYGNWKFVNMEVSTVAGSLTEDQFMKMETEMTSNYVTTNNKGSMTIEPGIMRSSNISYDISLVSKMKTKIDGVLTDSTEFNFNVSSPPSSGMSEYTTIGDSIFTKNSFVKMDSTIIASEPQAGTFKVEGNKLVIAFQINRTIDESTPDFIQRSITRTFAKINLERE